MQSLAPSAAAAAPALVIVGRAHPEPRAPRTASRLLSALPAAPCVLELGGDDALQRGYRERHPDCTWQRCDAGAPEALSAGRWDLLVVSADLRRLADPLAWLRALGERAADGASLWLELPNPGQAALLRALIEGDLGSDESDDGPWPAGMLQQLSPASLIRLLMDAGWMPTLETSSAAADVEPGVLQAALAMGDALAVPHATLLRNLGADRLVFSARRPFDAAPAADPAGRFCVVVPATRERQLRLNVERSAGLREVDARIVSCRGTTSPAHALEAALPHCDADWVLLCHQDVYFPSGFGARLQSLLAAIPADERERTLIGFAGMAVDPEGRGYTNAGFVIDRLQRFDHPASERAVSIDELAIVVSRRSLHRIDPQIGWHLWATDLCLASICTHRVFPRIVRLPLFHNSLNDYRLPDAFHAAAARLRAKYPDFGPIPTLCGTLAAPDAARSP